jgi:hypothetical protein
MNGTALQHKGKTGTWSIVTDKDGRIIYRLYAENNPFLYLLKLDENTLSFTDKHGNLLVGNGDFSYTLSRKW